MSATTTATMTDRSGPSMRNPKDSMKSTWRKSDKKDWTIFHWAFENINVYYKDLNKDVPKHNKTDKVPHVPDWQPHVWVWMHCIPPLAMHQAYIWYTGKNLGIIPAFLLYFFFFQWIGIHQIQQMRRIGHKYGYLDGDKHERDEIPDHSVAKVFFSLLSTSTFRSMMIQMLAYRVNEAPTSMRWGWLVLEAGFYPIILDFWFYWYHRVMHQFDGLWKFHRTHHLTKHPSPLLTLYADTEQEFFDICGIPLMTWITMKLMGFPMGFYEWWVCSQYVVFTELAGHSGLRISASPPSPFLSILRYFDAELGIEDHDLHHRSGWKKSHNYGKQTLLWDTIFGTKIPRIEADKSNLDYENTATIFVEKHFRKEFEQRLEDLHIDYDTRDFITA